MKLDIENRLGGFSYNLGGDPMPITGELVVLDNSKNESYSPLHKIIEAHPRREESNCSINL
jgi:hypothetical protein